MANVFPKASRSPTNFNKTSSGQLKFLFYLSSIGKVLNIGCDFSLSCRITLKIGHGRVIGRPSSVFDFSLGHMTFIGYSSFYCCHNKLPQIYWLKTLPFIISQFL